MGSNPGFWRWKVIPTFGHVPRAGGGRVFVYPFEDLLAPLALSFARGRPVGFLAREMASLATSTHTSLILRAEGSLRSWQNCLTRIGETPITSAASAAVRILSPPLADTPKNPLKVYRHSDRLSCE